MREVLDTCIPEAAVRYSGNRTTLLARRGLAMRQLYEERIRLIRFQNDLGQPPQLLRGIKEASLVSREVLGAHVRSDISSNALRSAEQGRLLPAKTSSERDC